MTQGTIHYLIGWIGAILIIAILATAWVKAHSYEDSGEDK